MQAISGFLKGVFYFFVGDWIILGGVAFTVALVALIDNLATGDGLGAVGGYIFFIGVALTLVITLWREVRH